MGKLMLNEINYSGGGGGTNIPNGSTVTPTDDIQIWLKCAELTETYTTLLEVLADDDIMEKLFRSENASNYLVRSTTWANDITANQTAMILIGANDYCANKLIEDSTWSSAISASIYWDKILLRLIPTMTGYTTPSGVASASSEYETGYEAWKAFASLAPAEWICVNNDAAWVEYEFPQPVTIKKVVGVFNDGHSVTTTVTFNIKVYYNGEWVAITDTLSDVSSKIEINVPNNNIKSNKMRIYKISSGTARFGCREVIAYGRATKTTIYSAANDIVSFIDDEGAKVVTTDATGKGEVTIVCKPNTDITFTSSVAKDPYNLSENYSKVVTIKSSAEPVYVMPNNALYWYGYKSSNLEDVNTTNGWTGSAATIFDTPTYNTNAIALATSQTNHLNAVGSKTAISGGKTINAIASCTGASGGLWSLSTNKNINSYSETLSLTNNSTDTKYSILIPNNGGFLIFAANGTNVAVKALWLGGIDDGNYDKADADLIAPVQKTLTAKKAYAVGEQFVYNQTLYKVVQSIAQGAQITIGTNAVLAGNLTEQICNGYITNLNDAYPTFDNSVKINTFGQGATNNPTGSSGFCVTERINASNGQQWAFIFRGRLYFRTFEDGAWGSWQTKFS